MSRIEETALSAEDTRRARILEGAKQAFLAYGFQRTTMDDIARAAEISRPALYLMFRNKTDIYRALAAGHLEAMVASARAVLAEDGPLAERLERSFNCILTLSDEIETSPHGAEILDMKNSLAADILAHWRGCMVDLVEAAIERENARPGAGPSAGPTSRMRAVMLLDAIEGMKMRQLPLDEQRETVSAFIGVVAGAAAAR